MLKNNFFFFFDEGLQYRNEEITLKNKKTLQGQLINCQSPDKINNRRDARKDNIYKNEGA